MVAKDTAVAAKKRTSENAPSDKGLKTKRLSQVKTPEGLKKANKGSDKKKKKPVANGKTKRLSQVKTPEGLKKKMKNSTPAKRKSSKPTDSSPRPTKKGWCPSFGGGQTIAAVKCAESCI